MDILTGSSWTLKWWKHARYEIRDGYIRPSAGAAIVEINVGPTARRSVAPHEELFRIFPGGRPVSRHLSNDQVSEIAGWCSRHGLLGLLPHRLSYAALWPRHLVVDGKEQSAIRQTRLNRTIDGWHSQNVGQRAQGKGRGFAVGSPARSFAQASEVVSPMALMQDLVGLRDVCGPAALGAFFPGVPLADRRFFDYPVPLSPAFWAQYAEPVDDFIETVSVLLAAAESSTVSSDGNRPPWGGPVRIFFEGLLAPVRVGLIPGRGVKGIRVVVPTLLSALALDLTQRLLQGGRTGYCPCGNFWTSFSPSKTYCSEQCRNRYLKSRYRAKRKTRSGKYRRSDRRRTGRP